MMDTYNCPLCGEMEPEGVFHVRPGYQDTLPYVNRCPKHVGIHWTPLDGMISVRFSMRMLSVAEALERFSAPRADLEGYVLNGLNKVDFGNWDAGYRMRDALVYSYAAAGPLVHEFTKWTIAQARSDGKVDCDEPMGTDAFSRLYDAFAEIIGSRSAADLISYAGGLGVSTWGIDDQVARLAMRASNTVFYGSFHMGKYCVHVELVDALRKLPISRNRMGAISYGEGWCYAYQAILAWVECGLRAQRDDNSGCDYRINDWM